MAYCKYCGEEISDYARKCEHCGKPVDIERNTTAIDEGGFGWGLLGFCIPLAGLILFLVWKDEKPVTAKATGIGALVNIGIIVLLYAIIFLIAGVGALA